MSDSGEGNARKDVEGEARQHGSGVQRAREKEVSAMRGGNLKSLNLDFSHFETLE